MQGLSYGAQRPMYQSSSLPLYPSTSFLLVFSSLYSVPLTSLLLLLFSLCPLLFSIFFLFSFDYAKKVTFQVDMPYRNTYTTISFKGISFIPPHSSPSLPHPLTLSLTLFCLPHNPNAYFFVCRGYLPPRTVPERLCSTCNDISNTMPIRTRSMFTLLPFTLASPPLLPSPLLLLCLPLLFFCVLTCNVLLFNRFEGPCGKRDEGIIPTTS